MKKKIAGVLTTVLAASLLVGGNSSVTVEKDNMIAQSQDSEETQSDEAEEEDTQSEEAEEVAKVAAGSYRDTKRRKKSREGNPETGRIRRQFHKYFLRRKNTSQEGAETGTAV